MRRERVGKMEYAEYCKVKRLWKQEKNIARALYRIVKYYNQISYYEACDILDCMNDGYVLGIHDCWAGVLKVEEAGWIEMKLIDGAFVTMGLHSKDYMLINKRS